jgi:hypothetical protein
VKSNSEISLNGRGLPSENQKYPIGTVLSIKPDGCNWYFKDKILDIYYLTNHVKMIVFEKYEHHIPEKRMQFVIEPLTYNFE